MRPSLLILLLLLGGAVCPAWAADNKAASISIEKYLELVRTSHPLFRREQLTDPIARERRKSFQGATDWQLRADTSYRYREQPVVNFGSPSQMERTEFNASADRLFWSTGGHLRVTLDNSYNDLEPAILPSSIAPGGVPLSVPKFYENGGFISYSQPLLKDFGGKLSRLGYELADFDAKAQAMIALENQEDFPWPNSAALS